MASIIIHRFINLLQFKSTQTLTMMYWWNILDYSLKMPNLLSKNNMQILWKLNCGVAKLFPWKILLSSVCCILWMKKSHTITWIQNIGSRPQILPGHNFWTFLWSPNTDVTVWIATYCELKLPWVHVKSTKCVLIEGERTILKSQTYQTN